jgi:Na+/H+ antiporter NhaC
MWKRVFHPAAFFLIAILGLSFYVGAYHPPSWTPQIITLDVLVDEYGELFYKDKDEKVYILKSQLVEYKTSELKPENLAAISANKQSPQKVEEYAYEENAEGLQSYYLLKAQKNWGIFSLLPALAAIGMCWMTKEPIPSLFSGILSGSLILAKYDVLGDVLIPGLSTESAAVILTLYLWLLGGLLGVWSRTGAAQAFATFMTKYFVRGPRTAKLVTWFLGIIFFQGGSVSTVLVGTTVKPLADKTKVSHEELAYIVDSTASPIAAILAFNAWPGYVQTFIYVSGVSWLATEADRINFFFRCVPFGFYSILAVLMTLLLAFDIKPFVGKQMRQAIRRARASGALDSPYSDPLTASELQTSNIPAYYHPSVIEFFIPLFLLVGTAVSSFFLWGSPNVLWAFGLALMSAMLIALIKGMTLKHLIEGLDEGFKGVVVGSVILLLAVIIGSINRDTGSGNYLVALLQDSLPFWLLPVLLQVITIVISFSTGTSWGTYAIAFPLAMPLAWAIANTEGLANPEFYMMICFASVMNGSIYGDQCSPISDTTVLSAMCTGCDLMDHVKTQIPQATFATVLAGIGWTVCVLFFA